MDLKSVSLLLPPLITLLTTCLLLRTILVLRNMHIVTFVIEYHFLSICQMVWEGTRGCDPREQVRVVKTAILPRIPRPTSGHHERCRHASWS